MKTINKVLEDYIEENIEFINDDFLHSRNVLKIISEDLVFKFKEKFKIQEIAFKYPDFFSEERILENIDLFDKLSLFGRTTEFKIKFIEHMFYKEDPKTRNPSISLYNGQFKDITKKIFEENKDFFNEEDKIFLAKYCVDIDEEFLKKHFKKNVWIDFCHIPNISQEFMLDNFNDKQLYSLFMNLKNRDMSKVAEYIIKNNICFSVQYKTKNESIIDIEDYKRKLRKQYSNVE